MRALTDLPGFDSDAVSERYILLGKIGAGGMGETVRAWDKRDGRLVAIKMPKAFFVHAPGFLERFDREARMLQRVVHPNIVPIADIGMLQGLPFFAMPFLPGGSLSARRPRDDQGKPLPTPTGMLHFWLPSMAAALDHLHAKGILHRDVKPANIFFDVFWQAFLGDFGLAKIIDEAGGVEKEHTLTGTNMAMGTELYMAPEMFKPRPVLTGAGDQYALAVSVYELLAGRRPFTGETAHPIVEVTTQAPPPLNQLRRDLPGSLVQAVHRCLEKRPHERFASCAEFAQAALAHVQPLATEAGIARLACPQCTNIIRIAVADAGRAGKCPRCRKQLVIAEDFSGLWTRSEQEIVAAHLSGLPVAAPDVETPVEATADDGQFEFRPLSKSVPVPKRQRAHGRSRYFATAMAVILSVAGGGLLVRQLWPRSMWAINPESRLTVDDGRLTVFSPKGFRRSSASSRYIVEYTHRIPGGFPRIRVLSGSASPSRGQWVDVGRRRGLLWSQSIEDSAVANRMLTATSCWLEVGGRPYVLEVAVPSSQDEDSQQLCTLMAAALKAGDKTQKSDPPAPDRVGLRVTYFTDRDLQHKLDYPDEIEIAPLEFDWFDRQPVPGLPADEFSIRWSGLFEPSFTGQHRFVGHRDDALRIWVNNRLVLDEWNGAAGGFSSRPVTLTKGQMYPIRIEYAEHFGIAQLTIKLEGESGEAEVLEPNQFRPTP
jgi:serine/threonine protein kinase